MGFSPSGYLTSQGWSGPGAPLQKGGLKKPVFIAQKTNFKGIGRERDTGYAWWDDVYALVQSKGKGKQVDKTATGIWSHRPSNSGTATPVEDMPTPANAFNLDIITQAKLEATRKEFYSKFLRGKALEGSYNDSKSSPEPPTQSTSNTTSPDPDADPAQAPDVAILKEEKRRLKELKRERKQEKAERKAKKEARRTQKEAAATSELGPPAVEDVSEAAVEAPTSEAKKSKRKRESEKPAGEEAVEPVRDCSPDRPKKSKKRRKEAQ